VIKIGFAVVNIRVIKLRKRRWSGYVARIMGAMRNPCKILIRKAEIKHYLGRQRYK
jgi:hypothetical protein